MHLITFSRKMGTNATAVARQVATELGYRFYETEAIEAEARKMGILESVREVDEKAPPIFRRLFSHRPAIDLNRLESVIYELASRGDAVFLGRGSQVLLKDFDCALHVRVVASLERRIRNLLDRGYDRSAALNAIKKSDDERGAFIKAAFGVDWENPELYDLVLNMDKLTVDLAVKSVVEIARSDVIKACSIDAAKCLETMGLSTRAEAALIEAGLTYGPAGNYIQVEVNEPGTVLLRGRVDGDLTRKRAEEIVRKVNGTDSVDNQIKVAPADRHA